MGTPSIRIALTEDVFGVQFAHLCCKESGLDVNILQEVVNGTNHLGVSKKKHVHDGRVIVQRGGARPGSRKWKG